jgi:hypothetical protein
MDVMPHITFIHGIANKPAPDVLLELWRRTLAREDGIDCGAENISTSMVYWADILYREADPKVEDHESADDEVLVAAETAEVAAVDSAWRATLDGDERAFVEQLADELGADVSEEEGKAAAAAAAAGAPPSVGAPTLAGAEAAAAAHLERVPLPWFIKRPLMKALLRDVHHYLFNTRHTPRSGESFAVRDEIRRRTLAALEEGAQAKGPHVVVSHSMGTVIAYDCLKRVGECPVVDALVTLGSPLGLDEIQDKFRPGWSRDHGFPHERVRSGRWINVFDRLDPVAGLDPFLANDYRRGGQASVVDIEEPSWGSWRHSITKYLQGKELRRNLAELLRP